MKSVNLVVRFLLEVVALISLAMLGWALGAGMIRFIFAAVLPILAATVWGMFAVPNDPSRSGNAPIPISGPLRLLLEFLFFMTAVFSFVVLDMWLIAWVFTTIVVLHYIVSYKRVSWLLQQ